MLEFVQTTTCCSINLYGDYTLKLNICFKFKTASSFKLLSTLTDF